MLLAFLILSNLSYWLWLGRFTPTRAIVNIDYLLLGILAPILSTPLLIVGFVLMATVDAFVFVSTLYHFTPRELVMSMSYARYSPIKLRDLPVVDIGLTVLCIGMAILLAVKARRAAGGVSSMLLGGVLLLVTLGDVFNGTNTYGPFTHLPFYTRIQHVAANPANSGLLAADPASFVPFGRAPAVTRVDSATRVALDQWRSLPRREAGGANVALVLVESWGQIDGSEGLTRAIAAPLFTPVIAARYDVKLGSMAFRGSTTNAELRELCGLHASYRDLFSLPRLRCLPDIFVELGYNVTGMHGFHGDMFDRSSWWPRIGIGQRLFLEDFRRTGTSRTCGTAFPGICDDDLMRAMGDRLTSPRQFVYALTINSHLPLAPTEDADGSFRCSALAVPLRAEACALAQQWHRVLQALAREALRLDVKPTQFIVVGDHSPPLLGTSDQNFSSRQVPYVILTPRAIMRKPEGSKGR